MELALLVEETEDFWSGNLLKELAMKETSSNPDLRHGWWMLVCRSVRWEGWCFSVGLFECRPKSSTAREVPCGFLYILFFTLKNVDHLHIVSQANSTSWLEQNGRWFTEGKRNKRKLWQNFEDRECLLSGQRKLSLHSQQFLGISHSWFSRYSRRYISHVDLFFYYLKKERWIHMYSQPQMHIY